MGLRINAQNPALEAARQTGQTTQRLLRGFEGLSSGERINRARDDAAGLAIAEQFRAEVRQSNREIDNLQSGVNFVQTAEGGLASQQDAVGRLRELSVQAANGTLTDDQRAALNEEAQQLVQQIDETAQNTEFNGTQPLNGGTATVDLGTEGNEQVSVEESTAGSLGLSSIDLSTQAGAEAAINTANTASTRISENRASLGAQQNRLSSAIETREEQSLNAQASESAIRDLDIARATSEQIRDGLLLQGGTSAILQGNIVPQNAARLLGG